MNRSADKIYQHIHCEPFIFTKIPINPDLHLKYINVILHVADFTGAILTYQMRKWPIDKMTICPGLARKVQDFRPVPAGWCELKGVSWNHWGTGHSLAGRQSGAEQHRAPSRWWAGTAVHLPAQPTTPLYPCFCLQQCHWLERVGVKKGGQCLRSPEFPFGQPTHSAVFFNLSSPG